jgi:hypothetical protein
MSKDFSLRAKEIRAQAKSMPVVAPPKAGKSTKEMPQVEPSGPPPEEDTSTTGQLKAAARGGDKKAQEYLKGLKIQW